MSNAARQRIPQPWAVPANEVFERLEVSPDQGLSQSKAQQRLKKFGPNRLRQAQTRSAWKILVDQFKSLISLLLVVAAGLAFLFGNLVEGKAIVAALLINGLIGFGIEWRVVRSMEALYKLSRVTPNVRRAGQIREIAAEDLVSGDVVLLNPGDVVTANLRLFEANKVQADESALTGQSVPVGKKLEDLSPDAPPAEGKNLLLKGTAVTCGSGPGLWWPRAWRRTWGRFLPWWRKPKKRPRPWKSAWTNRVTASSG